MTRVSLRPHSSLHSIPATQGVSKKGAVPVPTILPMWLHIQEANLLREAYEAQHGVYYAAVVSQCMTAHCVFVRCCWCMHEKNALDSLLLVLTPSLVGEGANGYGLPVHDSDQRMSHSSNYMTYCVVKVPSNGITRVVTLEAS